MIDASAAFQVVLPLVPRADGNAAAPVISENISTLVLARCLYREETAVIASDDPDNYVTSNGLVAIIQSTER